MNGNIVKRWEGYNNSAGGPAPVVPGGFVVAASGARPPHQESLELIQRDFAGNVVVVSWTSRPARRTLPATEVPRAQTAGGATIHGVSWSKESCHDANWRSSNRRFLAVVSCVYSSEDTMCRIDQPVQEQAGK